MEPTLMHAVDTFELVLTLLALVLGLHWLASKLKMPPASVLLVGGGALAFVPGLPSIALDPELALVLFLPPLLVDGAFYTPHGRFRRQLPGILSLAVGAVIFTTLAVGIVMHWLMPDLPWAACFALGAIVSPPDAVSARAVLKGIRLPRRLTTLLEGESLLNDATGLILFRFAVAATLSGAFHAGEAVQGFIVLALGGAIVGLLAGAAWVFVAKHLHDRMLIICASALLCWVAYLAGEAVHVSGVIATVVAGLMQGWYQHTVLPADVRLQSRSVMQMIGFVLEALVFILIGFSLRGVVERVGGIEGFTTSTMLAVLGVVVAVTVARFVWVFACDAVLAIVYQTGVQRARPLGWRQATVLSWAGMRGVVTLAIALTLPVDMPGRDLMLVCAFAVIFVTVILQGSSLGWLIRAVKPVDREPPAPMNMAQAEAAMMRARTAIAEVLAYGSDGTLIHPQFLDQHRQRLRFMERYVQDTSTAMDDLRTHLDVHLQALVAGREELIRVHRSGLIEDEVLHDLERDLDIEEMMIVFQRGD
ncbi:MAG TPA: Na+/H+ antiporter [Beijerinckiaceae bacterium]|jgi:CPA1 family monovalent cation:H+ antiporter|nr:Na+/H+ antiporter [Beijerinckiaceae bacterium]